MSEHTAEKDARRASILADVLSDHRPMPHGTDLVGCCNLIWESPDWRMHVGRAQVIALNEEGEHARQHGDWPLWEAVRTDEEDSTDPRFPWQPCLSTGGTTVPLRVWFDTEAACLAYIATIPPGGVTL